MKIQQTEGEGVPQANGDTVPSQHPTGNGQSHARHPTAQDGQDTKKTIRDRSGSKTSDKPPGGFESTPIPAAPPGIVGYTVRIRIHQATNLTMGDAHVFSSDPYIVAQLNTPALPKRHREDPPLRFRSKTIHRSTEPEWNEEWIVANVPSSGFKLKLRVYDADPADHDDLLGKVHITVTRIDDDWKGFKLEPFPLKLRNASKRALLIRSAAKALRIVSELHGELSVSIKVLERTPTHDGQNGRVYTVGPCRWIRHYSPMLGRIANIKEPGKEDKEDGGRKEHAQQETNGQARKGNKKAERYNFQANQMQLPGPVPAELYHRFVEFKPWVRRMFTTRGVQGVILGKALHHQHARVYNFGRATEWGEFAQAPSTELTKKFLELVHYDTGGRIFTYVLTLDALWRFTETGKEFGIDMLSKHTMHSDVSVYIAFSGEFFIRRLKRKRRPPPPDPVESSSQQSPPDHEHNETHPPADIPNSGPDSDLPDEPSRYELVIDNDSGTYRPNAAVLPILSRYLSHCLPGLHLLTLDCQADAEKMSRMKNEQRERKKREGNNIIYAQASDSSSISSSDDERLDDIQEVWSREGVAAKPKAKTSGGDMDDETKERKHGFLETVGKDFKQDQEQRMEKILRNAGAKSREGVDGAGFQGPKTVASDP